MKIYFDESEDQAKTLFLVGAIFIYGEENINLLREAINKLKNENSFTDGKGQPREIKYNKILTDKDILVAKKAIDLFFANKNTYFRCCVVPWREQDLFKFGRKYQPLKLKKAILYTNTTKKLIKLGIDGFVNAVLIYDDLVRCKGDKFEEIIETSFGRTALSSDGNRSPIIKNIASAKSNLDINNSVQLTDLILGCVLNQNRPASKQKNKVRDYLIKKLGVNDLSRSTWINKSCPADERGIGPKFYIHYLNIDELTVNKKSRKKIRMKRKNNLNRSR